MPVAVNEKYSGQVLLAYVVSDLKELTLPHKDTAFSYEFVALYYALLINDNYNDNMTCLRDN